jgi:Tol biopolymer transport system component
MKWTILIPLVVAAAACSDGSAQSGENGTQAVMSAALESGVQPQGIVTRRLASGDDVYAPRISTFSPDGLYQAFTDWSTRELAVRDLETGKIRQVTSTAESEEGFAQGNVFSSDATQIAYAWWQDDHYVLRTISVAGGEARTLFDPATRGAHSVVPFDWSSDDGTVLVGVTKWESATGTGFSNAGFELVAVSTTDGSVRALKSDVDFRIPYGRAFFSPDDRYVAYSAHFGGSPAMNDVLLFTLASGNEQVLLGGSSDDQVLGWSDDGTQLFVVSDRAGSRSIWAIPMKDGESDGDPVLIRREVHGFIAGHVANEKLFYHVVTETPTLYTMGLDLETGRVLSEPVEEEGGRAVWIRHPEWSPDGRFLAYARGNDLHSVVVRGATGNHMREFALPTGFISVSRMRWTPDSRRIVLGVQGGTHSGSSNVLTLTLATGEFAIGPTNPAESWPVSADGLKVYKSGGGRVRFSDLTTGETHSLFVAKEPLAGSCHPGRPSLSPDDDWLALVSPCVGVISTDGGEPNWIYRASPEEMAARTIDPRVHAWTADGSSVLFAKRNQGPDGLKEIWIVSADGGTPRRLFAFESLRSIASHPGNQRVAFMAGSDRYELWVMEGLEDMTGK